VSRHNDATIRHPLVDDAVGQIGATARRRSAEVFPQKAKLAPPTVLSAISVRLSLVDGESQRARRGLSVPKEPTTLLIWKGLLTEHRVVSMTRHAR
jgi:hypothetical protein